MCGFVAVARDPAAGPVTAAELVPLLARLRHRGPDGAGLVVVRGVGLAAARLAIQGDARGDQPVGGAEGRLAVAFNGELFARAARALRAWLTGRGLGAPPPEAGDTALLAAALAADVGAEGLGGAGTRAAAEAVRASGMGAMVAADLVRGTLWCVRDPLGVKPLAVGRPAGAREVWCASELTPLLCVPGLAPRLSVPGLAPLYGRAALHAQTPFAGLALLGPGSSLALEPGRPEPGWPEPGRPEPGRPGHGSTPEPAPGRAAAEAGLARALAATASEAAGGDAPATLFLSGGLDSAAVAAFAGRADLRALTGRFAPAGGAFDESAAAGEVARQLGLAHEVLDLSDADLLDDLSAVVRALELPVAGPGSLALWRLARHARRQGRIVLTGTGGDELLGGYARLALALGREGPWTRGYEPLAGRLRAVVGPGERLRAALDRRGDLAPLLDPGWRATLEAQHRAWEEAEPGPGADEPWDTALRLEVFGGTLPTLLHVEDRVLMAHGLEGRPVPCLGDVPAAALALPASCRVGPDGEGKPVLRALLRGRIPEAVRSERVKRGFPTPFARAAVGAGRAVAAALLDDRRFLERGWWDVAACRALLSERRPGHDRALFALLSWETWARLFLDGDALAASPQAPPPAPPGDPRR